MPSPSKVKKETRRRGDAGQPGKRTEIAQMASPLSPRPRVPVSPRPLPPSRGTQSLAGLRELQRLAASAIMRPLGRNGMTQSKWADGRPTSEVAAEFIKPNDRLTSFERL